MRMRSSCASLLLFSFVAGCGDSGVTKPVANKTHDVFTIESTFSDNFLQVQPGDTVRWHFTVATDGFGHNVIFNPRPAGTPADIAQEKKSGTDFRVFTTRGTFHYVCTLHGSMTADVIVE